MIQHEEELRPRWGVMFMPLSKHSKGWHAGFGLCLGKYRLRFRYRSWDKNIYTFEKDVA